MASLGLVGGCTADPPEPVDPSVTVPEVTATPSPTTTTPPEAVKPVEPEAMGLPGAEGAAAAAQYYFALFTYAFATGDSTTIESMSHPECVFCSGVLDDLAENAAAGNTTVGGVIRTGVTRSTQISDEFFSVDLTVESEPSQAVDATGAIVESFEAGSGSAVVIVLGTSGRWTVRGVEMFPAGAES